MSGYGYKRRGARGGGGSRWMNLHFAGSCKVCGHSIPAGESAFWDASRKTTTCKDLDCARADGLTTKRAPSGPWEGPADIGIEELSDHRIGGGYVDGNAFGDGGPAVEIVLSSGARLSVNRRGRCEDAPCCGCCT